MYPFTSLAPVEVDILRKECNYSDSVSAYGCLGVLSIDFEQVTFQYLVLVAECHSVGKLQDTEIFRITQTTFVPLSRRAKLEMVQELSKLLSSGQFYFSYPSYGANFDILSCAQKQGTDQPHFFWLVSHPLQLHTPLPPPCLSSPPPLLSLSFSVSAIPVLYTLGYTHTGIVVC